MEHQCPNCNSTQTYVKDVWGENIKGGLLLIFLHLCTVCRHQWETDREAYLDEKLVV